MKKRIMSMFIIFAMAARLLPTVAVPVSANLSGNGWTLANGTLTIENDIGMEDWAINISPQPNEPANKNKEIRDSVTAIVIEYGVTSIHDSAFIFLLNLTSVIIPDSVITIGFWSFTGCTKLTSVIIVIDTV